MRRWTVYRHVSPSGKVYIGITSRSVKTRWRKDGSGYKSDSSITIWNAIKKYGWDNFKHEILFENINEISAKLIEIDLIYYYKKQGISYNITDGGDGQLGRDSIKIDQYDLDGNFVQTFNSIADATQAVGAAHSTTISRGCRVINPSMGYYWRIHGEEFVLPTKSFSVSQYTLDGKLVGHYYTQREAAEKNNLCYKNINSALKRGYPCGGFVWKYYGEPFSLINKATSPVLQYKDGVLIAEYLSIAEASKITGVNSSAISQCCGGHIKSAGKFQWKYKRCISD